MVGAEVGHDLFPVFHQTDAHRAFGLSLAAALLMADVISKPLYKDSSEQAGEAEAYNPGHRGLTTRARSVVWFDVV